MYNVYSVTIIIKNLWDKIMDDILMMLNNINHLKVEIIGWKVQTLLVCNNQSRFDKRFQSNEYEYFGMVFNCKVEEICKKESFHRFFSMECCLESLGMPWPKKAYSLKKQPLNIKVPNFFRFKWTSILKTICNK